MPNRCNLAPYYGVGVPQELAIGMKYRLSRGFAAGSRATSNVPLIDSMSPASKGTGGPRYPKREHCYANGISMTSYRSWRRYGNDMVLDGKGVAEGQGIRASDRRIRAGHRTKAGRSGGSLLFGRVPISVGRCVKGSGAFRGCRWFAWREAG